MSLELAGAILCFVMTVVALLFSLAKSSHVEPDCFPNRARYFAGLGCWVAAAVLAVFMSFPGYPLWFVPGIYPVIKIILWAVILTGLFLVLTTVVAFLLHLGYLRRETDGRLDRVTLLEGIRQITSQPYPLTELSMLVLRELAGFMELQKGAIFLINPSQREMYLAAQIGLDKAELSRLERFSLGQDMISKAAAEQTPIISGDLAAADGPSRKLLLGGQQKTMSVAAVPLVVRDRTLGTLLLFCDKPYRFEKEDRMILAAAADALANVIETSRLARENQKLTQTMAGQAAATVGFRALIGVTVAGDGRRDGLEALCRLIVERYGILGCRIVRLLSGELENEARYSTVAVADDSNESYRVAVIDAIRRKKMLVLNQEARDQSGGIYIARSTLLCPLTVVTAGDFAMLIEAPGNGLDLSESFLADVEGVVGLAALSLNLAALKETDERNQSAVRSLLSILRIRPDLVGTSTFRQFLEEVARVVRPPAVVLMFARDDAKGYRLIDGCHVPGNSLPEAVFMPGEGPVGKTATTGEVLESRGRAKVEETWSDLDAANQDFITRLLGEQGLPEYQVTIPIRVMDDVLGVAALLGYDASARTANREIGLVRLAAELLSIRLSMARLGDRRFEDIAGSDVLSGTAHLVNQANNDLAAVLGRAELLARQPDLTGNVRYATDEIVRAAESAATTIRRLQEGLKTVAAPPAPPDSHPIEKFGLFLERHRVADHLFVFGDNRPVMLHLELAPSGMVLPGGDDLVPVLESVFATFMGFLEEGDEVLVKNERRDDSLYLSMVRGPRDKQRLFDPARIDFGGPEVIPTELLGPEGKGILARNQGAVSFDRFGRRPTYLSFRFVGPGAAIGRGTEKGGRDELTGLRILAIDDQQMILDLLAGISASLGLKLTAIQDPLRALELFKREPFDLVMVDLVMVDSSGWDVARQVKLLSPDTPVILMTGWGLNITPEEAARGGVDITLAKPFKIEQLTEVIRQARQKRIPS
ncbi:MAG: response regulator [candidate division Zixibacteria bacterium]|nr:response regulator [candidate division Zixibacteria bacterium]